ncbi:MAG: FtsX-like permease family protein, partial [Gemmatimonadetes bacterium]|nr:FtsX-like permease family protein [Gemmatimonadota bacterium]
ELAVRMALGCGRRSLARLLLFEALVLAMLGGGLGLLLGVWGMGAAYALIPGAPAMAFRVQGPVVGLALALTLTTALGVGLLPAARFSRPGLVSSLKEDSGGGGRRAGRIHRLAVSAQAGVALVLLVFCSLFLRSLGVMAQKELGFEPQDLLTTRIDLTQLGYASAEEAGPFLDEIRERVGALPGVASVSIADGIPLDLVGNFTEVSRSDAPDQDGGGIQVEFTRADERYFGTVGTPLLQGSGLGATADASSEPVVVITESVASRLWPGEDPLGRRIRTTVSRDPARDFTVVGVVPNVASSRAEERWPNIFLHLRQSPAPRVMVLVRSVGDGASVSRSVRAALLELEPALPYPAIVTSQSLVERSTQNQRMGAAVAGALGVLALLLSALGVYGVVAFSVSCRTREIGLRMAMGATRDAVLRGVFRDAVKLAVPGLAVGALLAVVGATFLRSDLLGLGPTDPVSFLAASALLVVVVVLASLVPARRAAAVDPMTAVGRR